MPNTVLKNELVMQACEDGTQKTEQALARVLLCRDRVMAENSLQPENTEEPYQLSTLLLDDLKLLLLRISLGLLRDRDVIERDVVRSCKLVEVPVIGDDGDDVDMQEPGLPAEE